MAYANIRGNMPCRTKIYAIFWDHHRARSLEKSVSWAILWYQFQMAYANMCGNMPCWTKIYAIFWDRHRARFPEKNSKTWEHIQNDAMLRSGFFSAKSARWRSRVLDFFFQDSRIRVNRPLWSLKIQDWYFLYISVIVLLCFHKIKKVILLIFYSIWTPVYNQNFRVLYQ